MVKVIVFLYIYYTIFDKGHVSSTIARSFTIHSKITKKNGITVQNYQKK